MKFLKTFKAAINVQGQLSTWYVEARSKRCATAMFKRRCERHKKRCSLEHVKEDGKMTPTRYGLSPLKNQQ